MKIIIDNIILQPDENENKISDIILKNYNISDNFQILKKSLDARKKNNIVFRYRILTDISEKKANLLLKEKNISAYIGKKFPLSTETLNKKKFIIIGSGPAGLFAALRLISYNAEVLILERGGNIDERTKDIQNLELNGILNTESNIQFGEGGAGTFSDGKLTARTNKTEINWFYEKLINFGAPENIRYESKPHIGTDVLKKIIKNIREYIIESGSKIIFNEQMTDLIIKNNTVKGVRTNKGNEFYSDDLILAIGHSARDTLNMLNQKEISMTKKNFAIGVRIEHPKELINSIQYGNSKYKPILPTAEYILTHHNKKTERGVYSFCMCPGGYIMNSSSEQNGLCLNGMSYSKRDSNFSNSAIVVTVKNSDTENSIFGGIHLQKEIEKNAFEQANNSFKAPAQTIPSYLTNRIDNFLPENSYKFGTTPSNLNTIFPDFINQHLKEGLKIFNNKMKGYVSKEGVILAPETRTSSPVRIERGKDFQSVNIKGLYPIGEGAGYSGGIVSSAIDGIRAADSILKLKN